MKCPICHSKNLIEVNEIFTCHSCEYILSHEDKLTTLKILYNKAKLQAERAAFANKMESIQKRSRKPYFRLRYFEL